MNYIKVWLEIRINFDVSTQGYAYLIVLCIIYCRSQTPTYVLIAARAVACSMMYFALVCFIFL